RSRQGGRRLAVGGGGQKSGPGTTPAAPPGAVAGTTAAISGAGISSFAEHPSTAAMTSATRMSLTGVAQAADVDLDLPLLDRARRPRPGSTRARGAKRLRLRRPARRDPDLREAL